MLSCFTLYFKLSNKMSLEEDRLSTGTDIEVIDVEKLPKNDARRTLLKSKTERNKRRRQEQRKRNAQLRVENNILKDKVERFEKWSIADENHR